MARPLRPSTAAAPTIAAAGSTDENLGTGCGESPPALNANPGICREALPPEVPEDNSTRIATPQTKIAVIHVIRTATRPVNLASDVRFTMTEVSSPSRVSGPGDCYPGMGEMATQEKRPSEEGRSWGTTGRRDMCAAVLSVGGSRYQAPSGRLNRVEAVSAMCAEPNPTKKIVATPSPAIPAITPAAMVAAASV